jgi:hypothetical protein
LIQESENLQSFKSEFISRNDNKRLFSEIQNETVLSYQIQTFEITKTKQNPQEDLMLSIDAWLVFPENNEIGSSGLIYNPITIQKESVSFYQSNDSVISMSFTATLNPKRSQIR